MKSLLLNIKNTLIVCLFSIFFGEKAFSQEALSVGFVSVTTDYKNIQVIAIKPDEIKASQYIFYRADKNSNNYKEVGKTTIASFTDTNVEPDKQAYCYRIQYIDELGKKSELSNAFCSIYLSSTSANSINWTDFSLLPNSQSVEYYIDLINDDGSIERNTSYKTTKLSANIYDIDGVSKELEDFDQATVRIRAIQKMTFTINNYVFTNYPIEVYSNSFVINPPPNIYVPTAFTPDGNGTNEIFLAKGKNITEFVMTIYNKWGNIIFESFDINEGWNGMLKDQSTPSLTGNYVYKIVGKDKYNRVIEKNGTVFLIK